MPTPKSPSPCAHTRLLWLAALLALATLLAPALLTASPAASASPAAAQDAPASRPAFLAPVLGDHMVLQRGRPNRFWGWSSPGDTVRIELDGAVVATAVAAADGRWQAEFPAPPAGGPYTLRVSGRETRVLTDVLCGEVWLCGGQSNMNWPLRQASGGEESAAAAAYPNLRYLRVASRVDYAPATSLGERWQVCSPATAGELSAVAFHFARRLQAELAVPVGIVQAALGGSNAESWMSPRALQAFPEFDAAVAGIRALSSSAPQRHGSFLMHWLDEHDTGARGETWASPALDDADWTTVPSSDLFGPLGIKASPAVAWVRRRVTLPDPLPAGQARLLLGVVDKMDTSYVNGRWVGASSWTENPRSHALPDGVLRPGENLVAVRVVRLNDTGGFMGGADSLALQLGDGTRIPLAGEWRARVSVNPASGVPMPLDRENYPTMPTVLHNGMLAPLAPLSLRGMLWYQGEANFLRAHQYRSLLPALIADWREHFRAPGAPFLIIGLPAFMQRKAQPGDDAWAELREAQDLAARSVPGAALVTTIDTGDANDIHPRNKTVVGERAAAVALALCHGATSPSEGPVLLASQRGQNGELRLRFTARAGGLVLLEGAPTGFTLAGADRKWHHASARLEGDTVVLNSPDVPEPVAARYAWEANPRATLFNGAMLPAAPFRTDDWPLSTEGKR